MDIYLQRWAGPGWYAGCGEDGNTCRVEPLFDTDRETWNEKRGSISCVARNNHLGTPIWFEREPTISELWSGRNS